jgi:hypothetical protein
MKITAQERSLRIAFAFPKAFFYDDPEWEK